MLACHILDTSMLASFHSFEGTKRHQNIADGSMWRHGKVWSSASYREGILETHVMM